MEPNESFILRWNGYEENTRDTLKKLRRESEFCDVTLACHGGKQVSAHKVILAGGSPFFQQILRQNPHPHPLVYLMGLRYGDLLKIIEFVYTGEATVDQEELNSFLEAAKDLQIKGLADKDGFTSNKKVQQTLSNTSCQDTRSVEKEETGPQPEVLLPQRKTPSRVNNRASQSPYQENQDDIDLTDTVNYNVSFGMKVNQSEELLREGTTNTMESQSSNVSTVTSPNHFPTIQHSKFSDPQNNNASIKSNHYLSQMPVELNIKIEKETSNSNDFTRECNDNYNMTETELAGIVSNYNKINEKDDTSNFNFEEDDFTRENKEGSNLTEIELAGSISDYDVGDHYWYEGDGEYTSATEPAATAPIDEVICNVCGKSFRNYSKLNSHMKDTGHKPFECQYCLKRFHRKGTLQEHIRIHTGEKPYECPFCHQRFTQQTNKNTHKKKCSMKLVYSD